MEPEERRLKTLAYLNKFRIKTMETACTLYADMWQNEVNWTSIVNRCDYTGQIWRGLVTKIENNVLYKHLSEHQTEQT